MADPDTGREFASRCVRLPAVSLPVDTPPVAPALFQTSAFETPTLDLAGRALEEEPGAYSYSRIANPTVGAFEAAVASLEGADAAVATASGMGALSAVFLGLCAAGDRIVAAPSLYGATSRLLGRLGTLGMRVEPLGQRIPTGTRLVFAEAISNPLLTVADVAGLARAAHEAGALLAIDATFATPVHCLPLALGADVSIHSATKFLGGHGDLTAGVAAGRAEVMAPVRSAAQLFGPTLAPHEAWLALRGLRTLALRLERQSAHAAVVAELLAAHPRVERVLYPGLPGHGTHGVALDVLHGGFGAMVSFDLGEEAGLAGVERFLGALEMVPFVASLGDVATTISHPAQTSHRGLDAAARATEGISVGLLRLNVGAEDIADIVADLSGALAAV